MLSNRQSNYCIIGAMSGTSLDGLDLVIANFYSEGGRWQFGIEKAETISYPLKLVQNLRDAINWGNDKIKSLDDELGHFIGSSIKSFVSGGAPTPDFIASHGHTIFHDPAASYTLQIGNSKSISEISGLPVINNFREKDVKLGGQGAPLVPVGDRDLFYEYDFCLNLGGIANVSFDHLEERKAFDICPFNMALNAMAAQKNLAYDDGGMLASQGEVNEGLLSQLNSIPYLVKAYPKSLGLEQYIELWQPVLDSHDIPLINKMCTFTEHAAIQISKTVRSAPNGKLFVTGGGAFNDFFISRLEHFSQVKICIPNAELINFKEALVFAYLGLLRFRGEINCLASVTGASNDNMGGDMYGF